MSSSGFASSEITLLGSSRSGEVRPLSSPSDCALVLASGDGESSLPLHALITAAQPMSATKRPSRFFEKVHSLSVEPYSIILDIHAVNPAFSHNTTLSGRRVHRYTGHSATRLYKSLRATALTPWRLV